MPRAIGLTLSLHSRIGAVADYVAEHARVGNLYVNRNQIGAVPGVQPFGGEGLSGTGPKAGGPNYLARFAAERVRVDRHHGHRRQYRPACPGHARPRLRRGPSSLAAPLPDSAQAAMLGPRLGQVGYPIARGDCSRAMLASQEIAASHKSAGPKPAERRRRSVPARRPRPSTEVADFVAKVKGAGAGKGPGRGRLIFAMDATMSREPTWDMALALQADMFRAVEEVGGLDVQLVYFRGAGECRASHWVSDSRRSSHRLMTQGRLPRRLYADRQGAEPCARRGAEGKVNALVYVGDAMEENIDDLAGRAGELALRRRAGVPVPGRA